MGLIKSKQRVADHTFAEWGYLGRGKFQRRGFLYGSLTQAAALNDADLNPLFAHLGKHDHFTPTKTCLPFTVKELADPALLKSAKEAS